MQPIERNCDECKTYIFCSCVASKQEKQIDKIAKETILDRTSLDSVEFKTSAPIMIPVHVRKKGQRKRHNSIEKSPH